ncbi:hypothetical protein GGI42DRAFT_313026 [Trichoderma sp. SZMC 28013]
MRRKVRNKNRKFTGGIATMSKDLTPTVYESIQPEDLVLTFMVVAIVFTIFF